MGDENTQDAESKAQGEDPGRVAAKVRLKDSKTQASLSRALEELKALRERAGALESENRLLREDLKRSCEGKDSLHKELVEILKAYSEQELKYKRMTLGVAAAFSEYEKVPVSEADAELLGRLKDVSEKNNELAAGCGDLIRQLRPVLEKMPLDSVERAKLKLAMEGLEKKTAGAATAPDSGKRFSEECRILSVSDDLNVVVLAAGRSHGIRAGLTLHAGKDNEIQLRVISVRPRISAAAVTKGSIRSLTVGMAARSGSPGGSEKTSSN